MADPVFREVLVDGGEPIDYYTQLYLEELERQREEEQRRAFAPPTTAPPAELPLPEVPGAVPPGFIVVMTQVLGRLIPILVPQPTGPRDHDELDEFDVMWTPPPPTPPPPGATDPLQPPNWNDLVDWPGTPTYVPITPVNLGPVEMPPGEPEVIVSPPKVVTKPTLPDEFHFPDIVEVPFDDGIGFGPGPAPAPTGTPGVNPDPARPGTDLEPFGDPLTTPTSSPSPDVLGAPLPDFFPDPIGDPIFASPLPSPPGRDTPAPTGPPEFFAPFEPLTPTFTPDVVPEPILTQFAPDPLTSKDQCDCGKKKKKKKRKPRDVCYRGTYTETRNGLSKKRLEEIPCESSARSARSSSSTRSSPSSSAGSTLGLLGSEHLTPSDWMDLGSSALREFAPIIADWLKPKKVAKPKKLKKGRKPKTRAPRLPGTLYTTPFPD